MSVASASFQSLDSALTLGMKMSKAPISAIQRSTCMASVTSTASPLTEAGSPFKA